MDTSRARFIVGSTLGAGAVLLLDRMVARAATLAAGDLDTLNAAIELERAAIKAYGDAAATKLLSAPVLHVAQLFVRDHQAHLAALSATVKNAGATPSDKTMAVTYPALTTEAAILSFALQLEEKAASTYLSVVPEMKDRELAGVVASILGVETVHAGILSQALQSFPPYPTGFVR